MGKKLKQRLLFWTPEAEEERQSIRAYIEAQNPRAALKLDALFAKKAQSLLKYPHMGRPGRLPGTREWVVHPNYILVYSLTAHSIYILRLLHAARLWRG